MKLSYNVRKFARNSWNFRCLQLRHALGWPQSKLIRVLGVNRKVVKELESGDTKRPSLDTIRRIKNLEAAYADILEIYKKHPVRMDRLKRFKPRGHAVILLPIEVRRPEDIETLGKVEGNSQPIFFGRATRRKMQQAGMSVQRKAHLNRKRKAISLALRAKYATGWSPNANRRKVQLGQPNDEGGGA